jgi:hypothetical protein
VTSFSFEASHASSDGELMAEHPSEAGQSLSGEAAAAALAPEESPRAFSKGELCSAAASVAEANNLPVPFFANLIQQESGFKPNVVSSAGAQGIAQFMPRVAVAYGLTNPFDPIHALGAAGRFLAELVARFGNLGLAAAAYNAGPKRVRDWLAKRRKLPAETRHYVQNITGRPAEQWTRSASHEAQVRLPPHARCPDSKTMEAQDAERAKTVVAQVPSRAEGRILRGLRSRMLAFAARSGRKSVFVAAAKQAGHVRASRKPSATNIKAARALPLKSGPAIVTKRVRVQAAAARRVLPASYPSGDAVVVGA